MDVPQTITQTVAISLSAGLTWTAALDAAGTLTPILNTSSGSADDDVSITIDSSGYASGSTRQPYPLPRPTVWPAARRRFR